MTKLTGLVLIGGVVVAVSFVAAQPPGRPGGGPQNNSSAGDVKSFIARMMQLDADQDGQLSKDEVTDTRLLALFERADTNKDGMVTKEELTAVYNKESATLGRGPGGGGPGGPGGPGFGQARRGFGGPPSGPGGPGGPGGFGGPGMGGPPPIGTVLPSHIQEMLKLTNIQKKKLEELQKLVDTRLEKILTEDQQQQLAEMRNQGPGGPEGDQGFGPPPDGPGGPGAPGGPGPGGNRRRPGNNPPIPDE